MRRINGRDFTVHEGRYSTFWDSAEQGMWEPYTFQVLEQLVPHHTTYIDVGAWIGPTVLYASRLCNNCFAIEPDPVAYDELKRNISLDGANITLCDRAILDYEGIGLLGSEQLGNSMTRLSCRGTVIEVLCQTLSSFMAQHKIEGPTFIKMDVEGAEELILSSPVFAESKPTLYVSLHTAWYQDRAAVDEAIQRLTTIYRHTWQPTDNALVFTNYETPQSVPRQVPSV